MESTSTEPLRLDAGHNTNWQVEAKPVAILNEASTLHERIAYCWGLANAMQDLACFLNESECSDVRRVSGLFFNQTAPLVKMLDHMGSETDMAEFHKAQKIGGAA
jgi:hypothetical protein